MSVQPREDSFLPLALLFLFPGEDINTMRDNGKDQGDSVGYDTEVASCEITVFFVEYQFSTVTQVSCKDQP